MGSSARGIPFRRSGMATGLPLRIRGRWIYLTPTRYGFLFFAMLGALLFGSINHNNNLGFILAFLLGGIALVSTFHTLRTISGVSLGSARAEPVFAGQPAVFELVVNPARRNKPAVSFRFPPTEGTTVDLPAGYKRTLNVSCPAEQRGLLQPGTLRVSTSYPLGLFGAWSTMEVAASCLVYPRPVPGPMISAGMPDEQDGDAGDSGGPGVDDFAGLEIYRQGDPLQHISWKAYSRGQGLYTKKFEGITGRTLFFDPDALPGRDMEYKLSRICYMVLSAEAMCVPYGLQLGDRLIAPDSGGAHKRRCLRALALAGRGSF